MFQKIGKQSTGSVSRSSGLSVIGPDVRIVGDIITQGEMEIDGEVDGDITCQNLMVGEGAKITGSVHANVVRVHGSLTGKIDADSVSLSKSARVVGDITHNTLQIDAGAMLEGHLLQKRKAVPQLEDKSGEATAEDAKADQEAKDKELAEA